MIPSRYFFLVRRLSTSSTLRRSYLSADYKSKDLWDERFKSKLLTDEEMIKTINNKIISDDQLNNLELDIFINIAVPNESEVDQLRESAKMLSRFRASPYAHSMLPSTSHGFCRLFLYSNRIHSLILALENRVKYGIFPDFFAHNLLIDYAIDKEDCLSAARLATIVMLQEEFGLNQITDNLSLLSVLKYIESKTNFEDWNYDKEHDEILKTVTDNETQQETGKKQESEVDNDGDGDEEDADYIRVPFLRNPYFDNHFDITNPRLLCAKTLRMLGKKLPENESMLAIPVNFLSQILQGAWEDALTNLKQSGDGLDGSIRSLARHYVDNLHGLEEPPETIKADLLSALGDTMERLEPVLSNLAEKRCLNFKDTEIQDIEEFRGNLVEYSKQREEALARKLDRLEREKILQLIEAKKKDLRDKEEYLYFFDNLKKKKITRIEYN